MLRLRRKGIVLSRTNIIPALIILLCTSIVPPAFPSQDTNSVLENVSDSSAAEHEALEWIALPRFSYAPETGFQYGVFGQLIHQPRPELRHSTLAAGVSNTTRKQIEIFTGGEWYLDEDRLRIKGGFLFSKWPNEYYGIGNNTPDDNQEDYTERKFSMNVDVQRSIFFEPMRVGLAYRYRDAEIEERENGGLLDSPDPVVSGNGLSSGLGIVSSWDSRDQVFYPQKGVFYELSYTYFGKELGSEFTFREFKLDVRHYFPLDSTNVFAVQFVTKVVSGQPPFQQLPQLGGAYLMRGYFKGRYRDKALMVLQGEYRFDLLWRFGGVIFGGIGDVASSAGGFQLRQLKYSVGLGIRFKLMDSGFRVRADFGYGSEGFGGPYITGLEAF